MDREPEKRPAGRDRIIDALVFTVILAAVSAVTLTLFYKQTLGSPQKGYHSDMKAYILEMQGLDSGYSFPYPVFFKTAAFFHLFASPELSVALAAMLLNSLAVVIVKLALNRLVLRGVSKGYWLAGVWVSLLTVSLFFISMLFPPVGMYLPGIKFIYLGVFSPNPFHNATYMAARPFAVLAFLWYVKLLGVYENGVRPGPAEAGEGARVVDYVLFSLFLLLATMTKPSFTIVLLGTAGLIMLYRLFRSKFHNLVPTLQLGLCFIPTFLNLLYQYRGVFVPQDGSEGGIGFSFGEVWAQYSDNIPLAMALAIGFPLAVLVLNFRELKKNTIFCFSWQFYLMGFAMAFFLYEKGFRQWDFNFSWGYMYGIFFCHFGALVVLMRATLRAVQGEAAQKGKLQKLFLAAQWLAYLWHLACGLYYFGIFWRGGMYY